MPNKISFELRQFGITHWVIRPDTGMVYPVFIRLPIELRRRLHLEQLSNDAIIDYALQKNWVIVQLTRLSSPLRGYRQLFQAEVWAASNTFGGRLRPYHSTVQLLRALEDYVGSRIKTIVRIFDFSTDTKQEIISHLASSADFAKLFIHSSGYFTRPVEYAQGELRPTPSGRP